MRILAINLLRLGDVVMTSGVLHALKEKYPGCELHLLTNSQCSGVNRLLNCVDKFIYFDRERAQKGLGEFDIPLLDSFDYLKGLIAELNSAQYDLTLNFSQNLFSARVMGLIESPKKLGMTLSSAGKITFGSPWLEKLNKRNRGEPVHYIDFMARSSGIQKSCPPRISFAESSQKQATENYIVVQALTSDEKKNWGLAAFQMAVRLIARHDRNLNFLFLAAPNEESQLAPVINELRASDVHAELKVCNLAEATKLIAHSKLLITGDTSIKHLAAATQTPILELSLGSSDFHFTGAYSENAFIFQANVACAPCAHRGPCPLKRKICNYAIDPQVVARMALAILRKESLDHFENLYRGKFLKNGLWSAESTMNTSNFDLDGETLKGVASDL